MKTGFTFETKLLIHMVDNTQIYAKWHKHAFSKVKKTKGLFCTSCVVTICCDWLHIV